jgi:hypothetical protein
MLSPEKQHKFFPKSKSPFQKWTKKMSKNENPKYFCAKTVAFPALTEDLFSRD